MPTDAKKSWEPTKKGRRVSLLLGCDDDGIGYGAALLPEVIQPFDVRTGVQRVTSAGCKLLMISRIDIRRDL